MIERRYGPLLQRLEADCRHVLSVAESEAETVRRRAHDEAQRIVADAHRDELALLSHAAAKQTRMYEEAQAEIEHGLDELETQRAALVVARREHERMVREHLEAVDRESRRSVDDAPAEANDMPSVPVADAPAFHQPREPRPTPAPRVAASSERDLTDALFWHQPTGAEGDVAWLVNPALSRDEPDVVSLDARSRDARPQEKGASENSAHLVHAPRNRKRRRRVRVFGAALIIVILAALASVFLFNTPRDDTSSLRVQAPRNALSPGSPVSKQALTISTTSPPTVAPPTTVVAPATEVAATDQASTDAVPASGVESYEVGTPAPAPAPDPAPAPALASPAPSSFCDAGSSAVIDAMNTDRAANGMGALCGNAALNGIAQNWANWMAQNQSLTHQDLNAVIGGVSFTSLAENLLEGPGTMSTSDMEALWMGSALHRANILNSAYGAAGVGVAFSGDGRVWVAVDFGG